MPPGPLSVPLALHLTHKAVRPVTTALVAVADY